MPGLGESRGPGYVGPEASGPEDMGGIKAVTFDRSGTVVDFGFRAPVEIFIDRGIANRDDEARGPMGLGKRHHIASLAQLSRIADARRHVHGHDIDELHGIFDGRIEKAARRRFMKPEPTT